MFLIAENTPWIFVHINQKMLTKHYVTKDAIIATTIIVTVKCPKINR